MNYGKGLFLVWPLGWLFFELQPGLSVFGFYLPVLHFCLEKSSVGTLIRLSLTLRSLEILCKNISLNISMIAEAKKRWVKNPYGGIFNFFRINVDGFECFRCVCHVVLIIIYLTLLPNVWDFTVHRIMFHHPCIWWILNTRRYLG